MLACEMSSNLENSALATGLEKISFHFNPNERQCQRLFKLLYNYTHFIFILYPKQFILLHKHQKIQNMQKRDLNNSHNPTQRPFPLTHGTGTQGKGALGQQLCDPEQPPSQSLTSSIHKAVAQTVKNARTNTPVKGHLWLSSSVTLSPQAQAVPSSVRPLDSYNFQLF